MNFKTITGGTEAEALAKFPWLTNASFEDAVVDITQDYLVWEDGTWEDGTWEGGYWEGGIWKRGTWKDGIWDDGTWEDGTWEDGYWKDGTWKDGYWKDGTWDDGIWERGTWKRGQMWSNIHQEYKRVAYEDGKFTVEGAVPAVEEITIAEAEARFGVKIKTLNHD